MKNNKINPKTLRTILNGLFAVLAAVAPIIATFLVQPYIVNKNPELHQTYTLYDGKNYEVFDASSESFSIGANSYNCGFTMTSCESPSENAESSFVLMDLQNKYSSISFIVGRLNNSLDGNATLIVFLDNKLFEKYKLNGQASTQKISIETKGKSTLRFELVAESEVIYGFAEFYLHK